MPMTRSRAKAESTEKTPALSNPPVQGEESVSKKDEPASPSLSSPCDSSSHDFGPPPMVEWSASRTRSV